jgi:6-phosphogluconolactonase (cycloisomerase 2 family)
VPFAFTFTPSGRVAVGEAGTSSLTTYLLQPNGTLSEPKTQSDGQSALCWVQQVGPFTYVANTGSNTLSAFRISDAGQPSLLTQSGVVATTEPGPIDLTSPSDSSLLYDETGLIPTIGEYQVNPDGSLAKLGQVNNLPAGIEGIAST